MAEIMEVFEDFGENAGKVLKDKKFLLLAGGVGLVALFVGYRKNQQEEVATAYEAIGYAGYPTVGGSSSSESVYSNEDENLAYFEQLLGESQTEYEATINEMESNVLTLSDRLTSAEEANTKYVETIERQNALSQMRANSELYNALSTPADANTRAALHEENIAIAEKYGFTFDSGTGNWYDGNDVLYTTSTQQAAVKTKQSSGGTSTAVNYTTNASHTAAKAKEAVSYDPNKDYTLAIQEAKSSGASQSVINQLYAERNAKIDTNPDLEKYRNDV